MQSSLHIIQWAMVCSKATGVPHLCMNGKGPHVVRLGEANRKGMVSELMKLRSEKSDFRKNGSMKDIE